MSTTTTTAAATNRWYLSAAPIARALVHLCVPMAAAMVVSALYNVINAGFIGAQHDTSLLAAITFGTPLLAYAFGAGDAARLRSGLRAAALTVGGIVLVFSGTVFVFREQVFTIFSGDHSVLAIGMTILTAQLVAAVVNGFTGLLTSLFQATGMVMPAMVLSMAQGVLFIPIVIAGNVWFGLAGIIWALTVTEGIVFVAAVVLWLATRGRIARGLAEGSAARADAALEAAPVA